MTAENTQIDRKPAIQWRPGLLNFVVAVIVFMIAGCALFAQVALWRAQLGIETRNHDAARAWLATSSWAWPRKAEWFYLSAKLHRRNAKYEKFRVELQEAHKRGWSVADLEYEQLLALAQTGQYSAVESHWSQLFQRAGSDGPEICRAFVNSSLAKFQFENVATVIAGWKADFPEDNEPYYMEAKITFALQHWGETIKLLKQVLLRDPDHRPAKQLLAESLFKQQNYRAAIPLYQELLANGESPDLNASLVKCYLAIEEFDSAKNILDKELRAHPDHQKLNAEMGSLLLAKKEYVEAIPFLKSAINLDSLDTQSHYNLAESLKAIGKDNEAQIHFRHVDNVTKASLELANLTQKIIDSPDDIGIRFRIGELTWKWKSKAEGKSWLMSVLAYEPDHQPTLQLLAEEQSGGNSSE